MIALLQAKAAGLWSRSHIQNNVIAGIVVGIVALPLAMAFAIASGARPEQGLYTAIVAAVLTALFGGTRVQVSGPTGAFIAVLSIITAQHGIAGLQMATLMAGIILVTFGAARLGAVIKYIPDPVIAGFTAGIGVIIFVGQWKDFLGLSPAPSGLRFHEKLWSLIEAMPTFNPATAGLALLALAILTVGARYLKRVPAPLVALIVITVLQSIFHFKGVRPSARRSAASRGPCLPCHSPPSPWRNFSRWWVPPSPSPCWGRSSRCCRPWSRTVWRVRGTTPTRNSSDRASPISWPLCSADLPPPERSRARRPTYAAAPRARSPRWCIRGF
jgi:MFS superfamily sulfate permease-like transporter